MNRHLPIAVFCGLLVGLGLYWVVVPDWRVALATTAVYAGAGYFYLAFEGSLLDDGIQFEDRADKLGYAIGLFGLSVSPIALTLDSGPRDEATVTVIVLFVGVIAFLLLVSNAQQNDRAR